MTFELRPLLWTNTRSFPSRNYVAISPRALLQAVTESIFPVIAAHPVFSSQVTDFRTGRNISITLYIVSLIPALILLGQVRNLKYLVPFSMLANIFMVTGFSITLYYVFSTIKWNDISNPDVKLFSTVEQLPRFFATVIFAIEGIGVVSFRYM